MGMLTVLQYRDMYRLFIEKSNSLLCFGLLGSGTLEVLLTSLFI